MPEKIHLLRLTMLDDENEPRRVQTVAVADDGEPEPVKRSLPDPMPVGCEVDDTELALVSPADARVIFADVLAKLLPGYGAAADNELARTVRNQGRAIERIEGLLLQLVGRTDVDRPALKPRLREVIVGEQRVKVVERLELDTAETADDDGPNRPAPAPIDWAAIARDAPGARASAETVPVDWSREVAPEKHAPMDRRAGFGLDNVRDGSMNVGNPKTEIERVNADGSFTKLPLPKFGDTLPPRSDIK